MTSTLRSKRGALTIAFWAVGVAAISWLTPEGPHDGWQPPGTEVFCGFLPDSKTMVTAVRLARDEANEFDRMKGPIRLWNIETGELRASHFGSGDLFAQVSVNQRLNALCIQECVESVLVGNHIGPDHESRHSLYNLRIHEVITGREISRFQCRNQGPYWEISEDGKTTAFCTVVGKRYKVSVHDVASGRRLSFIPGYRPLFSPDSQRIATCSIRDVSIFDVLSGNEIVCFNSSDDHVAADPEQFSRDGKLLLDSLGSVWDVETGTRRFRLPDITRVESSLFTVDGKALMVVDKSPPKSWLAYYDTNTGKEILERRVFLSDSEEEVYLEPALPDCSLITVLGTRPSAPSNLVRWMAKLPYLSRTLSVRGRNEFALVEASTGRELMRHDGWAKACTPDVRYFVCEANGTAELWDIPPRKPLRWVLSFIAIWTVVLGLAVALLAAFAGRKARLMPASQK
jgi:WD40 repeat protein